MMHPLSDGDGTGVLAVISGFSGVGKGTIVSRLMADYPQDYVLSVSATTRAPRPGEVHGTHYFFLSVEAFEQMIREHALLEHAQYVSNYYGTPRAFVEEKLAAGVNVILEIEIQGALKVKEQYPDAVLIFIAPPQASVLYERLAGRGTETEEVIASRLARACEEAVYMPAYDYIVVNDVLDTAVAKVHQIISDARLAVSRQDGLIDALTRDLNTYVKGE